MNQKSINYRAKILKDENDVKNMMVKRFKEWRAKSSGS